MQSWFGFSLFLPLDAQSSSTSASVAISIALCTSGSKHLSNSTCPSLGVHRCIYVLVTCCFPMNVTDWQGASQLIDPLQFCNPPLGESTKPIGIPGLLMCDLQPRAVHPQGQGSPMHPTIGVGTVLHAGSCTSACGRQIACVVSVQVLHPNATTKLTSCVVSFLRSVTNFCLSCASAH